MHPNHYAKPTQLKHFPDLWTHRKILHWFFIKTIISSRQFEHMPSVRQERVVIIKNGFPAMKHWAKEYHFEDSFGCRVKNYCLDLCRGSAIEEKTTRNEKIKKYENCGAQNFLLKVCFCYFCIAQKAFFYKYICQ